MKTKKAPKNPVPKVQAFFKPFMETHDPGTSMYVAYKNRRDQVLRFVTMCGFLKFEQEDLDGNPKTISILDVGCGVGDFKFFVEQNITDNIDYTGIDCCPEMIQAAADAYQGRFIVSSLDDFRPDEKHLYDYVVASGIFNSPGYEDLETVITTVKRMFELSTQGVAFNFLEFDATRKRIPELVYTSGGRLFSRLKKICDRIVVLSDYSVEEADTTMILLNDHLIQQAIEQQMNDMYNEQERRKQGGELSIAAAEIHKLNGGYDPIADLRVIPDEGYCECQDISDTKVKPGTKCVKCGKEIV